MTKSKKIYKQWTVQSPDLESFESEINYNLKIGWEVLEGSYQIIEEDGVNIYSQALVWREEENENINLYFSLDDYMLNDNDHPTMQVTRRVHRKNRKESTETFWFKTGFGRPYLKQTKMEFDYVNKTGKPPHNKELRQRHFELRDENKNLLRLIEYNDQGIKHGKYIDDSIQGKFNNGKPEGEIWTCADKSGHYYQGICQEFICLDDDIGFGNALIQVNMKYSAFFESLLKNEPSGEIEMLLFDYISDIDEDPPIAYFKGRISRIEPTYPGAQAYRIESGVYIRFGHHTWANMDYDDESPDEDEMKPYIDNRIRKGSEATIGIEDKMYRDEVNIEKYKEWYPHGTLMKVTEYGKTAEEQAVIEYYPDGQVFCKRQHDIRGKKKGTWERYFCNGQLNRRDVFLDDHSQETYLYDSDGILRYECVIKSWSHITENSIWVSIPEYSKELIYIDFEDADEYILSDLFGYVPQVLFDPGFRSEKEFRKSLNIEFNMTFNDDYYKSYDPNSKT